MGITFWMIWESYDLLRGFLVLGNTGAGSADVIRNSIFLSERKKWISLQ
jgi:hypothetical protein